MPTFPQHRNMKKAAPPKETREPETTVTDQTNNLPAISDLVSSLYFWYYLNDIFILFKWYQTEINVFFSLVHLSRKGELNELKIFLFMI